MLPGVGRVEPARLGKPVVEAVGVKVELGRGQPSVAAITQADAQGFFPARVTVDRAESVRGQSQRRSRSRQLILDEPVFEVVYA